MAQLKLNMDGSPEIVIDPLHCVFADISFQC